MLLLSAAFLSHFSTAVIGVPAAGLAAVAVALAREPRERAAWRWVALSVVLALAISYVVYYSHFHEVYARTLSRVGTERASTSLVATLSEHSENKAITTLRFLASNYGWPALALSAAGLVAALGRGWRDGWSLVLLALSTTVAAFLALGAFTPIEMRASLAAQPLVAAFAALGCAWLWQSGRSWLKALVVASARRDALAGPRVNAHDPRITARTRFSGPAKAGHYSVLKTLQPSPSPEPRAPNPGTLNLEP